MDCIYFAPLSQDRYKSIYIQGLMLYRAHTHIHFDMLLRQDQNLTINLKITDTNYTELLTHKLCEKRWKLSLVKGLN